MAHRIEPFRDYSEHEVINLFALDYTSFSATNKLTEMSNLASGNFDSGVIVKRSGADALPGDLPGAFAAKSSALRAYLGHDFENVSNNPSHVGSVGMPANSMLVTHTDAGNDAIGITLRQTLAYDENGENLMRYPVKKDELQAVGPGETVPVLTRGLVLVNTGGYDTATTGMPYTVDGDGKFAVAVAGTAGVATCLAVGDGKALLKISF
jgi:hypothetical protein